MVLVVLIDVARFGLYDHIGQLARVRSYDERNTYLRKCAPWTCNSKRWWVKFATVYSIDLSTSGCKWKNKCCFVPAKRQCYRFFWLGADVLPKVVQWLHQAVIAHELVFNQIDICSAMDCRRGEFERSKSDMCQDIVVSIWYLIFVLILSARLQMTLEFTLTNTFIHFSRRKAIQREKQWSWAFLFAKNCKVGVFERSMPVMCEGIEVGTRNHISHFCYCWSTVFCMDSNFVVLCYAVFKSDDSPNGRGRECEVSQVQSFWARMMCICYGLGRLCVYGICHSICLCCTMASDSQFYYGLFCYCVNAEGYYDRLDDAISHWARYKLRIEQIGDDTWRWKNKEYNISFSCEDFLKCYGRSTRSILRYTALWCPVIFKNVLTIIHFTWSFQYALDERKMDYKDVMAIKYIGL